MAQFMIGWSLERRDAERALYAEVVRLRRSMTMREAAAMLGITPYRGYALLSWPPLSEEQWQNEERRAEYSRTRMARHRADMRKHERLERKHERLSQHDEAREIRANAMTCLVEALEEMRPYVGTEAP